MKRVRRKEPVARTNIYAGDNMRCPNGHAHVYLDHGRDLFGKFLEANCRDCGARQTVRAEGRS